MPPRTRNDQPRGGGVATTTPQSNGDGPARPTGKELVARAGTLTKFIELYGDDFARVMPAHSAREAFMGLAVAYVRRDNKLYQAATANPAALILALRECAALGHMPMPKIFALVPFRDSKAEGGWTVVGIETYHGVIERMYRAGMVTAVKANLVRRNDAFAYDEIAQRVTKHTYSPYADDEERGPLAGVYAYAELITGGQSRHVWLNAAEVAKHRAASRSGDAFWGGTWEPAMWLKTGCHALETWVPTSVEYRTQVTRAEAEAGRGFRDVPDRPTLPDAGGGAPELAYVDAEVVPDQAPAREERATPSASAGQAPAREQTAATVDTGGADPDTDPVDGASGAEWPPTPTIPGTDPADTKGVLQ